MTLTLDARQRAMLLEMGVRVWHAPSTDTRAALTSRARTPGNGPTTLPVQSSRGAQGLPVEPPPVARAAALSAPATPRAGAESSAAWSLAPLRLLYPNADPALTPTGLGAGWLVVAEAVDRAEPWADSARRLLDAMLQALQLHLHPRVGLCELSLLAQNGNAFPTDISAELAAQVATFAPSVLLVMGRGAVRAALGRAEPLGKLREADLAIAGVPAVATYDVPFLLRNPQCKRMAWADLCRARALVNAVPK